MASEISRQYDEYRVTGTAEFDAYVGGLERISETVTALSAGDALAQVEAKLCTQAIHFPFVGWYGEPTVTVIPTSEIMERVGAPTLFDLDGYK